MPQSLNVCECITSLMTGHLRVVWREMASYLKVSFMRKISDGCKSHVSQTPFQHTPLHYIEWLIHVLIACRLDDPHVPETVDANAEG